MISRKEYSHVAQASRLHRGDAGRMPALRNWYFIFWKSPKKVEAYCASLFLEFVPEPNSYSPHSY